MAKKERPLENMLNRGKRRETFLIENIFQIREADADIDCCTDSKMESPSFIYFSFGDFSIEGYPYAKY